MIKGVIFDIDDTLYSHKLKAIPPLTMKALKKLKEKGIKVGVCTSREPIEMSSLPSYLMDELDCQIFGTGSVTMIKGKYYKSYTINQLDAKRFTDYFHQQHISYFYTDLNTDVFYYGDQKLIAEGQVLRRVTEKVKIKKYEDEEITNLFFYHANEEQLKEMKKINPNLYVSRWGDCGNISPEFVDKSFGVLKFCQMFSFTTDEVVACGDGINDDVMLKMAGIGIAVKDSKPNTLEAADYICKKSIEDGGIYEALVDLKIIEDDKYSPKAFFFDNDLTIFDHSINDISESTMNALKALKEKGYILCLNTSRAPSEMGNIPSELYEVMDVISMLAGAFIQIKDQSIIKTIPSDQVKICIDYCAKHNLTYRYCRTDGKGYLNRHDEGKEQLFYEQYRMIPPIKEYEGEVICHFLYYGNEEEKKGLKEFIDPNLGFSVMGVAAEVTPSNVDKGQVIKDVAKIYNIDLKDTCAFGDSGNDIAALNTARLSIAMGNSSNDLKMVADYITDNIGDEGIAKALKHFNFI